MLGKNLELKNEDILRLELEDSIHFENLTVLDSETVHDFHAINLMP